MVQASVVGITPDVFYTLTLGEVMVAIEGYQEREKQNLINRIVAIGRALSKGDPLQGLKTVKKAAISIADANLRWLWSKD